MTQANKPHITLLEEMLRALLVEGVDCSEDLVNLAAAGELLRRAVILEETPSDSVREVLVAYERCLAQVDRDLTPPSLADDLAGVPAFRGIPRDALSDLALILRPTVVPPGHQTSIGGRGAVRWS